MKKVLAFFGAFNPPTNAHINSAREAMHATDREGVIFVPSQATYILTAQHKEYAYGDEHRLEMLQKLASRRRWMKVCSYDIDQAYQPRTYETLCHLRSKGYEPSLLVGSDILLSFSSGWKDVDKIAKEFGIVCVPRGETAAETRAIIDRGDPFLKQFSDQITVVDVKKDEYIDLSSTKVRFLLQELWDIRDELEEMLPWELFSGLIEPYKQERKGYET